MSNEVNDVLNREAILGSAAKSYNFDKVIRGYDPKQVDTFIDSLVNSNKNASEIFDSRYADLRNENSMLSCELDQVKGELKKMNSLYEKVQKERDELRDNPVMPAGNVNISEQEKAEFEEKIEKLSTRNRLLQDENKKLEEKNRDMQRDIAHLTKKVDKNRAEIKDLSSRLEEGMENDDMKKYSEVARIYESAIDKAEDLIYRLQSEFSLAHSKAEDAKGE
ncbi:MAG: DivIVA domain-containing protein [Eubacterium sp.]|nr:DivIVA domain-containing protein [Eubacterium sp.]